MAEQEIVTVKLRRAENSQPWGFRMRGGKQVGMPLFIEHVAPKGRSAAAGLSAGDAIFMICGNNVQGHTHEQAKSEILRAGNELDFLISKHAMQVAAPGSPRLPPAQQRTQVIEEPTVKLGGPTYKQVTPKTYQVLHDELPASEQGAVPRPASIFDRKKQERSQYLKTNQSSIQKAYGEKP